MRWQFGMFLLASLAWAQSPRVDVRRNEVWLVQNDQQKQLTNDGRAKLQAVLSQMNDRVAYYEQCPQSENCIPSIVILDLDGKRLQSFQPQAQAMPPAGPCGSILNIFWIESSTVAVECHVSPSISEYVETDLQTNKTIRDLVGFGFTPSPDHKWIAHVGPLVHFAPTPEKSNYLLINNTTVYPLPKGAKPSGQKPFDESPNVLQGSGSKTIGIHEFVPRFSWSWDSKRVAFVDCTFDWIEKGVAADGATPIGDETNHRCSLAVVSLDGTFSLFPLADIPLNSVREVQLSWTGQNDVQLTFNVTKLIKTR
jgi:hypothetical protein